MHKLLYPIICLLALGMPQHLKAQKTGVTIAADDPFASRKAVCTFNKAHLPDGPFTETVPAYMKEHNENLKGTLSNLVLQYQKTSPGGKHLTFDQTYAGIPVFNSQVKVNIDNQNNIDGIVDNTYNTSNWGTYGLDKAAAALKQGNNTSAFMAMHPHAGTITHNTITIAVINNQPAVYRLIDTYNEETAANMRYLIDANGKSAYDHDLNRYSGTVQATCKPFVPDPLTTSSNYYDTLTPWSNHHDSDNVQLNGERKSETINVSYDSLGHFYYLKNDRIEILNFSPPANTPPTSPTPSFQFTRSQSNFEDVNVFYHISVHNAHIAAIGFDSLANFYTRADSHAGTDDNSMFSDGNGTPSLFFGDGGVNDAEDADVIVHEYSHAISNNASPNGNSGQERSALDEGLADYFATSYSRSMYEFRWADMFTWDGHNEFWPGRTATSSSHYPEDLGGSIHTNGEMWNSALMKIWGYLGRTTTDRLMLQTLYSMGSGITFTDAAVMFIHSDSLLNNGANTCLISTVFFNHGFIDSTQLPTGCKLLSIEEQTTQNIKVVNTDGFAYRNEPVMVENIGLSNLQKIELFDVTGKLMLTKENLKDRITYLYGTGLANGLYFLRVYSDNQYSTYKLVKANE